MISRRHLIGAAAAAPVLGALPLRGPAQAAAMITREIPSSGEAIPALGMGTWITFNVGPSERARKQRAQVLQTFFDMGGGMIDSSPMYGTSEDVIGWCLKRTTGQRNLVTATKVWTSGKSGGIEQMTESRRLWGVEKFDVMQVHNLVDWETHLGTLRGDREAGRVRYVGITTSHGSRHEEMERIMRLPESERGKLDFVQLTYNVLDREAEDRLLPLAADKGIGVIVNRPFQRKGLFRKFQHEKLPGWAGEAGAANWAQFFLKFILGHRAVTCAIPATSQVVHMKENMGALTGRLPDAAMRKRMVAYVEGL